MADADATIRVGVDTGNAAAQIKALQKQMTEFNNGVIRSNESAASSQRRLNNDLIAAVEGSKKFETAIVKSGTEVDRFNKMLDKGKIGFKDFTKVAGSQVTGLRSIFKKEFDTIGRVAEDRVKKMQTQYVSLGKDIHGVQKTLAITPKVLDKSDPSTKLAIATEKARIFNRVMDMGANGMINWGKNTQWAGRQLMVGFTVPLSIFGGTASKIFMELEEQAINFRKVYGDIFTTDVEVEKNLAAIKELSGEFSKYGISAKETMDVANVAAQAGARGADLMAQTTEATRLSVLGQMQGAEAMQTVITMQNAFGLSNKELADSVNFLNIVENQSVLSLQDVAGAIPRVAPVVKSLGGDVKDLSVMLVAMREGGVTAAEGANALKTSLANLISPSKAAIEMSNELGINLNGIVEANQGDILGAVRQLGGALENLDELSQQRLLSEIFGKRQYARIGALFNNITNEASQAARVMDLTAMSAEELAQTATNELGAVEESVATKFTGAVERLKLSIAPIGEMFLKMITPFIEKGAQIFDWFNNLGDTAKTVITGIVAVIGGIAPALLMGVGLIANFIGNTMKTIVNIRKGMQNFGAMFSKASKSTSHLTQEQIEAATASASLEGASNELTNSFISQDAALENLIQTYRRYIEEARQAAQANPAGFTHMPTQPPAMGMSRGGEVPGQGNKDTQPAMLTPGEFVVNADSAKQYGPLLEAINNGQDVQGLNGGGWAGGSPLSQVFKEEAISSVDKLTALKNESKEVVRQALAAVDASGAGAEQVLAQIRSLFGDTAAGIGDLEQLVSKLKTQIAGVGDVVDLSKIAPTSAGKKSPSTPGTAAAKAAVMGGAQYQAEISALTSAGYKDRGTGQLDRSHLIPKAGNEPEDWSGEKVSLEHGPVNKYLGSGTSGRFASAVDDLLLERERAMEGVENNYDIFLEKIKELGLKEEQALAEVEAMIRGIHPVTTEAQKTIGAVATYDVQTSKMAEAEGRSIVGPGQRRNVGAYGQAEQVGIVMDTRAQTGDYSIPQTTISGEKSEDVQKQQAKEAGIAVQEGFQEGMTAGQEETEAIARRSVDEIVEAVKQELEIASPSGVFKKIGDWAMEGLGKGFEEDAGAKEIAKNGARVVIAAAWEAARAEHGERAAAFKATIKRDGEMVDQANAARMSRNDPNVDDAWSDFFDEPREATTFDEERERSERIRREKEFEREERQTEMHQREMDARQKNVDATNDSTDELSRETKKTKKTRDSRAKMQLGMQKVSGAFFGATMALDAISMGMAAMGKEMSDFQKQLLVAANGITMFLPMLSQMPPGLSLLLLAVAGVTAALLAGKAAIDNVRRDAQDLADAMVASRDDVKKIGEFYGTESLIEKERMQRKLRETGGTEEGLKQAEEFVATDAGQQIVQDFGKLVSNTNVTAAADALGSKLASMVLQGVIDNAQAWELANVISEEAGVDFIQMDVKGKLTELIGRKGEDVLEEPLEVAIRISQENEQYVGDVSGALEDAYQEAYDVLERGGNLEALQTDWQGNWFQWALNVPDWMLTAAEEEQKYALQGLIESANQYGALVGQALANDIDNYTSANIRLAESEEKLKELRKENAEAIKAGKTKEEREDIVAQIKEMEDSLGTQKDVVSELERTMKEARERAREYFREIQDKPLIVREMFTGMDQNLRDMFEGTGLEGTVNDLINTVKDIDDQEARFDIMLSLQTGEINPVALNAIYDLFPDDANEATRVVNYIIETQGLATADQLFNQLARLNVSDFKKQEILIAAETMGAGEVENLIWALNSLASLPPEINKYVNAESLGAEELVRLKSGYEDFLDQPDVKKYADIISHGAPGIEDLTDKIKTFGDQEDHIKFAVVANIQYQAKINSDLSGVRLDAINSRDASGFTDPHEQMRLSRAEFTTSRQLKALREELNSLVQGFDDIGTGTEEPELPPVGEEQKTGSGGGKEESPWEQWMKQIKQDNKMKVILQRLISQGVNPQILMEMISRDDQVLEEADRRYQKILKKWRKGGKKGAKPLWREVVDSIIEDVEKDGRVSPSYIAATGGRKFFETIASRLEQLQAVNVKAQLALKGFDPRALEGLSTVELQYLNSLTGKERQKAIKELDEITKKDVLGKAIQKTTDSMRSIREERDSFVELMQFGIPVADIVEGAQAMGLSYYEMALMIREGTFSAAEFAGMMQEVLAIQKQMDEYAEVARYARMDPFERYDAIQDIKGQIAEIEAMQIRDKALRDLAARDIRDSLGKQLDTPEAIQREIDKITWEQIVPKEKEVARIQRLIEPLERLNELDQRQIDEKNKLIEGINEQYDAQFEALDKIAEKEQSIFELKQSQLNIANALSRGDIAAAAQAMLDAQRQNAEQQRGRQRQNLEAAKEEQIKKINEEIEEINERIEKRKKTIQEYNDDIYDLEKDIEDIQYNQVRRLQEQLDLYGFETGAADTIAGALALQQAQERATNGYYTARTNELRNQISLIERANSLYAEQNRIRSMNLTSASAEGAPAAAPGPAPVSPPSQDPNKWVRMAQDRINAAGNNANVGNWQAARNYLNAANPYVAKANKPALTAAWHAVHNRVAAAGFAYGGLVPGMGNTDSIPAMLMPGEYVIKKSAAQKFMPLLEAINGAVYSNIPGISSAMPKYSNDKSHSDMYNYNIEVNAGTNASADDIANAVITKIKMVDGRRVRGYNY